MERQLCPWAKGEVYIAYHDQEWGVPLHDDQRLFEMLILEGMQAGLSWITILKKRPAFRRAFDGFDPQKVAMYDEEKIACLLQDKEIVRNRLKIRAAVGNAAAFLQVQREFGSFDAYIWSFTDGKQIVNRWEKIEEMPATSQLSDEVSRDLKHRGFRFVGSTICYSFMQAIGMINDHMVWCDRYTVCIEAAGQASGR